MVKLFIFRLLDMTSFKLQICTAHERDIRFLMLGSHVTGQLVSQPYLQPHFGLVLGFVKLQKIYAPFLALFMMRMSLRNLGFSEVSFGSVLVVIFRAQFWLKN